jgi:hypothetical protein
VDDDARNDTTPEITDGSSMSCRLFRKAVQQGRSERRGESYSVPYVEPLSEARTMLEDFVNGLLVTMSKNNGSGDGGIGSLRRTQRISRLSLQLVRLQLDPFHNLLKVGPFCRSNHFKLKAKLPLPTPPDNCGLNLDWRAVINRLDPDLQSSSWLHSDETLDATTPDGEIHQAAFSTDHCD